MLNCKFVRELTEITVAANTDSVIAQTVTLDGNTLSAGQRDRWEQYRIRKVKFTFTPAFNVGGTTTTAQDGGSIFTIVDPLNDANPVMSANQALNYPKARRRNFFRPFSIYFSPTVNRCLNTNDSITSIATIHTTRSPAPWLGTSNDGTMLHYGSQVLFNHIGPNILKWGVIETMYVQFRTRNGK